MYVDEIRVQPAENRPQKQVQERLREYILIQALYIEKTKFYKIQVRYVKFGFACWSVTIHSIIALFLYKFILTPVVYYVKFFSCIRTCFVIFDGLLCLFLLISYNTCYFQKTINYITKINNSKIFINKKHRGRCKHSVHLPHLIPRRHLPP